MFRYLYILHYHVSPYLKVIKSDASISSNAIKTTVVKFAIINKSIIIILAPLAINDVF